MQTSSIASRALGRYVARPHGYPRNRNLATSLLLDSPAAGSWTKCARATIASHVSSRSFSLDAQTYYKVPPPFAFAFDIDGVLLHVDKPIPGAKETLQYLQEKEIPFILLTNGGGKHEEDRVAALSQHLGVPLSTDNFIQSHTPFKELVDKCWDKYPEHHSDGLRDRNIYVTGSDPEKAREIAEKYGFKSVITAADILVAHPRIFPFDPLRKHYYKATARPLPNPKKPLKIDAIFVFNDPRDWALDMQIITDLLLAKGGVLGTYSKDHLTGRMPKVPRPHIYFSNPDLFWSANYPLPRLGQGAFQAALKGLWRKITLREDRKTKMFLPHTMIGKPYERTYDYAEKVLLQSRAEMYRIKRQTFMSDVGSAEEDATRTALRRIYMVGDNPASDILGANNFRSRVADLKWESILVRTGVWSMERDGRPSAKPTVIVDDVRQALEWVLEREKKEEDASRTIKVGHQAFKADGFVDQVQS